MTMNDRRVENGSGVGRLGSIVQAATWRGVVLSAMAAGLLLLGLLGADLLRARYEATDGARRATSTAAAVVAEHIGLAVTGIDNLLVNMRHGLSAGVPPAQVLAAVANSHPYLTAVHLVGADGRIRASTEGGARGVDVGDRSYLSAQAGPAASTDRLWIGPPLRDQVSGETVLPMSRRLEAPDGGFDGVVVGMVDRDYLAVFLATQALGLRGGVGLFAADGTRLAGPAPPPGTAAATTPGEEIVATERLRDLPLVVRVAVAEDVALATWTARARVYALMAVGLVGLLALLAGLALLHGRRAREALDAAVARAVAERASAAKTAFVSSMSHELRTPVVAMDVIARDLESSPLGDDQRAQVATLRASIGYLLSLVGGVLDLARVEAGRLELIDGDFTPDRMLDQIERLMGPSARAKGLTLTVRRRALPGRLEGDAVRVQQVLLNLIGNAIKYTPEGEVVLDAALEEEEEEEENDNDAAGGTARLVFQVRDSGPGLPDVLREGGFGPFTGAAGGRHDSTGLGLAVARDIAEALGGRLDILDTSARGTTFRFAVPVRHRPDRRQTPRPAETAAPPAPHPPPARRGAPTTTDENGLMLLLAEDDPAQTTVFRATLAGWGHRVDSHGAGDSALAAARQGGHDALIVDVHLPRLTGLDLVRRLRAEGVATPIIGLTAAVFSDDLARYRRAGFDHLLVKPVDWMELRGLLDQMASGRSPRLAPISPPPPPGHRPRA